MLSMSVCELTKFLVGNLIVLNKLKEAIKDSKRVTVEVVSRKFTLKSPHTIMFVDTLQNLFKTNSK